MRIYLIRHGETPSNAGRVVQTPDTPLSDTGAMQAEQLAKRMREVGITKILSSNLRRAVMTAETLSEAIGIPVERRADLQERNYGEVRGLPYDDVGANILDPDYEPPGGETWREFHQRVDGAWTHLQKVAEDHAEGTGDIAVVTHGLVLYSLVSRRLDCARVAVVPVGFHNTSVTIVETPAPWGVVTLNCIRHLEDEESTCPEDQDPRV